MGRKGDDRVYQFVDDLVSIGVRKLTGSAGLDETAAREHMTSIAHELCFQYARTSLYVPASLQLRLSPRDEEIWAKYSAEGPGGVRPYSSARVQQLATEYAFTVRHVYNIIALMRDLDAQRRQPGLPGIDPAEGPAEPA